MAEYNFWDDRTHENNDSMFCPIINGTCWEQKCDSCVENAKFQEYYELEGTTNE